MKNVMVGRFGGFTLIELLVVVLIIGILAAVALPQYDKAVLKSRAAGQFVLLEALDKAQTIYRMANGTFATDIGMLDLELSQVTCHDSNQAIVYCQFGTNTSGRVALEFQGAYASGEKWWICLAKKGDDAAQSVCRDYYKEWRGTRVPYENDKGYMYYWSAPR